MAKPKYEEKVVGDAPEIARDILPGYSYSSTWKSPETFAQHVEKTKDKCWCDSGWETDRDGWHGSKSMQETLKLSREGWKEGAEKVEALQRKIEALHPTAPRMTAYDIAGSHPNVPRAIAGNIKNMHVPESSRSRKRPVITIVSNMSSNWTISADCITNRAAVVAAIIDKIEASGYSCEVISTATTAEDYYYKDGTEERTLTGYTSAVSVIVKRCNQPVDIKRLAFGLGHASMFRRMVFADWGSEPTAKKTLGEGLGYTCMVNLKKDKDNDIKSIYILPSAEKHREYFENDERSATDGMYYLMRELQKQGCPAFPETLKIPEPKEIENKNKPK